MTDDPKQLAEKVRRTIQPRLNPDSGRWQADPDGAAALNQLEELAVSALVSLENAEKRLAEVTTWLNDWVKVGQHTQEWQFYIGKLFDAVALAAARPTAEERAAELQRKTTDDSENEPPDFPVEDGFDE